MSTTVQKEKMESLLSKRDRIFERVQKLHDLIPGLSSENLNVFMVRLEKLDEYHRAFEETIDAIDLLSRQMAKGDSVAAQGPTLEAFEELYFIIKAFARQHKLNESKGAATTTNETRHTAKLPKLQIPTFSGDLKDWPNFYAMFRSTIHKQDSISAIEKLQYLRSFLSATPLSLIEHLHLSAENYSVAYNILVKRYENKRSLASFYLNHILNFTPLQKCSLEGLRKHLEVFKTNYAALEQLSLPSVGDFFMFHFSFLSLDPETRKLFENKTSDTNVPSFASLMEFIESQVKIMEVSQQQLPKPSTLRQPDFRPHFQKFTPVFNNNYKPKSFVSTATSANSPQFNKPQFNKSSCVSCPFCKEPHPLQHCPKFSSKSVAERQEIVGKLGKCTNCLNNHNVRFCNSQSRCRRCGRNHHTLLHFSPQTSNSQSTAPPTNSAISSHATQALSCQLSSTNPHSTVLLGTAKVNILDNFGIKHTIRIVVDPGSMVSCITESCAQSLGLTRHASSVDISGIGNSGVTSNKGVVSCTLSSTISSEFQINTSAIVLSRISGDLPTVPISQELIKSFSSLKLADPTFHISGKIDFLLGADVYPQILINHGPTIIPGEPTAINSAFGWILLGRAATEQDSTRVTSLFTSGPSLETIMRSFWEIEEVENLKPRDPDDVFCEEHFLKTHSRDKTGRYLVRLPFKSSETICTNRKIAYKQYENLQRRLQSKPEVHAEYQKFFKDYYDQGHMQSASSASSYVIPHHPVFKSTSSTTKLRAVFNASHYVSPGSSLNAVLHKGPKLQQDICNIVNQFRTYAIPVCADIKQMYRQILIHPDDLLFQHIFWQPDNSSRILEFQLNTVTYGITPSAFQAQRVVKQLATDEGESLPLAVQSIETGIYIDDVISGADNEEQALALQQQLIQLFRKGGFELRKWTSNSQAVLDAVPDDHLEVPLAIDADDQHTFKILGLYWDSNADSFGYTTNEIKLVFTKRALLSNIARIFDPMGWLAPLIFWAKHVLQLLWRDNYEWDQPLSSDFVSMWTDFVTQLFKLKSIKIPRFILHPFYDKIDLLGFCDSSSKGYAAVLYIRVCYNCTYKISLLKAKSKVAPSKNVLSIPKLELCAAVLLSRLLNSVKPLISKLNIIDIHLFSDSTIVLCWLKTAPHLLEVFVANRVVEILKSSSCNQWYHVRTELNPADCASRGLLPQELVDHSLWWNGPSFLQESQEHWPLQPTVLNEPLPCLKPNKLKSLVTSTKINPLYSDLEKFSTFTRITHVFAYVLRFIANLKRSKSETSLVGGPLLVEEIKAANTACVRIVQERHFGDLLSALRKASPSSLNSQFSCLTPFIDQAGLLRVGGRLKNSPLTYSAKHPLLLPAKTNLATTICDHYHRLSLHGGPRIVQSLIQQKYWIISVRNLLRQRIHKCMSCFRFKAKLSQPIMADLPADRFSQIRAFYKVGVDFGGPFSIKEHSRRNARITKGYLCLFVCFSTKAVHLELVSDLSTAAFLAAFDRFVARRGLPSDIYSDNGTNFHGGFRYLQELYKFMEKNNPEIHDHLLAHKIKWHFNPPSASNFGGLFEAGIKSAKHHLRRIVADHSLTFEEFSTLLCRIEAVMNSRPLIDPTSDPHDLQDFLTPGHFLIGTPLVCAPEESVSEVPLNRLTRWQLIQNHLQSFWKIWSRDYLHGLIKRRKWDSPTQNIKENDIVIIKNQSTSPLDWPLGRVLEVFPGSDGVVRVVKVRTAKSILTRPVNKLLLVP